MSPVRAAIAALALGAWAGASSARAQAVPHAPPKMLHPVAGKQDCLSCHGAGANAHVTSVPASHHFANAACGMCHKPIAETPPAIRHAVDEAHTECRKCHVQAAEGAAPAGAAPATAAPPPPAPGAAPAPPASHASFDGATCRLCHEPAAAAPGGA
jgi:cytochrome c554/c'-like protein